MAGAVEKISGFGDCLTMPDAIVDLSLCDGRVIVTLADGRIVDVTDWFQSPARVN